MTVLQNTVTEPDGSLVDGWLAITLVGNPFRSATQTEVLGSLAERISDGSWSVDLTPGPYEVVQRRADGSVHSRWLISVPDSEASVWLADALATLPATPSVNALVGISEAVVDGAGHLQVTYTDGTVLDAGMVQGPPGEVGGSAPDATPTTKGIVQLAGDLAGTATAPTVPGKVSTSLLGASNGVATLDSSGKVPQAQIPSIALTEFLGAVASQVDMLALTGQRGDWCTRTDLGTDWQLTAEPSTSLASWRQMTYPASPVSSVAGRTGAVTIAAADVTDSTTVGRSVLTAADAAAARTAIGAGTASTKTDVGLGSVDNTSDQNKPVSTAQQTALDAKAARTLTKRTVTAAYTLVAADATDLVLHSTAAAAVTITLPQDSAATIAQEVTIPWRQYGVGQITFAAGAGATLISRGSLFKSAGQYAEGLVTKTAANTWLLSGDITA